MEFRWLAVITLWTVLSGPVFGPPSGGAARPKQRKVAKKVHKSALSKKVTQKS